LLLTMAVGGGFLVACGDQKDANEEANAQTAAKYGIKVDSETERDAEEHETKVTPGSETPAAPEEFEVDGVTRQVDLRTLPPAPVTQRKLSQEMPAPLEIKSVTSGADTALQPAKAPAGPMPAATTFAGMNFNHDGAGWPPDTDGPVVDNQPRPTRRHSWPASSKSVRPSPTRSSPPWSPETCHPGDGPGRSAPTPVSPPT
jgi:hypothetical protein